MPLTFEQRRRVVLVGFASVTAVLVAGVALWRREVWGGTVWLFSDSFGAIILLSLLGTAMAAKARRHRMLMATRPHEAAVARPRFASPPAEALVKLLLVLLALAAVVLWFASR